MDDAEVAVAAACAGADVVRALYGQRLTRVDKGGGDFATAADVEAEQAILDVIRAARPMTRCSARKAGSGARPTPYAGGWWIRCAAR